MMKDSEREALSRLENKLGQDECKNLIKQAIKEWLNDQFAAFGKWSLFGILAAAMAAGVYLIVMSWHIGGRP